MTIDSNNTQQILQDLRRTGFDPSGLRTVGVVPTFRDYLNDLWDRRHFIWMDAHQRVATQNSRNFLGNFWLVLRPMLDAIFYFVLFSLVLQIDRGIENFPAYLIIGILLFAASSRAISQGPSTIKSGRPLIRAFSFPRAAIPIAAEVRNAMQSVPAVLTMLVMIMIIPPHVTPHWMWIVLLPVLAIQCLLNLGLRLVMARIGFHFPDIAQLMSFVSRVLMYTSGILIPVTRFTERYPGLEPFIEANPLYQMLVIARSVLMDATLPPAYTWLIFGGWAVGLALIGFIAFWRGEAKYGADLP